MRPFCNRIFWNENGLKCQNQLPSLRFVSACDDQTAKKDDVASVTRDVTCDKNK